MQPTTSKKAPPPRSGPWIALALLTLAAAVAILWFFRPAPRQPRSSSTRALAAGQGSYRNRSILKRPAGAPAEAPADKPAVQGYVYDSTGVGLSGATVVATTFDQAGNVPSPVASTRTDGRGHFAIPLARGSYQIGATLSGYGPSAVTAEAGITVSMVLHKAGAIQGHVVDENGQPVQRFTIDVLFSAPGDAPALPPAWSKSFDSADGSYRADQIPAWPVVVRAVSDALAPGLSQPISVRPGETRDVDLKLTAGCTLTGTVKDKEGNPLPRVLVNAEERLAAGTAMEPTLQTSTQAQSGDDGSFTLEHVPAGTVVVRGYDGDYAVTTVTTQVGDCAKLAPVKLVMSAGGAVAGVARKADGQPLSGALVSVTGRAVGFVNTTTALDGSYRFESLPVGDMRIELESSGQRTMTSVRVKDGETFKADLKLVTTGNGEVRGRVTAGSRPIAGARLLIASNHGEQEGIAMYFPVSGEDGTYRVPSLPEGNYLITVIASRASSSIQVHAGETSTVDLDAGFMEPSRARTAQRPAPAPSP